MKRITKAYTSFTRMERAGIIALSAIIVLLIIIRTTMYYWVHPAIDKEEERKYIQSWETYKRSQGAQPLKEKVAVADSSDDYQDAYDESEGPLPSVININTADSATLVRLKGIGPATASKIIAHRKEIGPFKNVDEMLEIRSIPKTTYVILKKHLSVK